MKTLVESLFDRDLVSKDVPAEVAVKKMDKKTMCRLSPEERLEVINDVLNSGTRYTCGELRFNPVNLQENVLVAIRTRLHTYRVAEEVCKYVYFFQLENGNSKRGAMINLFNDSVYWDMHRDDIWMGPNHWKAFVSAIDKYYGGGVEFIVLPKSISEVLVKKIWMKTLVESLFDRDLVTRNLSIDKESVMSYIEQKIKEANKRGVNVEIDEHPSTGYVISFRSKDLFCPDNRSFESYMMMINVEFVETDEYQWVCVKPYDIYGISKGLSWKIRLLRIDPYMHRTNQTVDGLKLNYYLAYEPGECKNIKKPEDIYGIINSYFELFEKLNDYRLFDNFDEVSDMNRGKLMNIVYDKLKKIWPKNLALYR